MALRHFEHATASSVAEAAELATAKGEAAFVAGGTDLLGTLKDRIHADYPELLIDIKPIASLREIKSATNLLRIGALTTLDAVGRNPDVLERYPVLAQAARAVASPQIRNMGTVGGNLCQEPRCWYYRAPENLFPCMRKGGERCNAVLGDNRHHSIFGASRVCEPGCVSDCPAGVPIPVYLEHIRAASARTSASRAATAGSWTSRSPRGPWSATLATSSWIAAVGSMPRRRGASGRRSP